MLKIKLARVGRRNQPSFRLVVSESERDTRAKHVEIVGHMIPTTVPKTVVIKKERVLHWMARGAQPTSSVHNLLVDLGVLNAPKRKTTHLTKKRAERTKAAKSK